MAQLKIVMLKRSPRHDHP